ncbi:MAG TPA: hypothetical protein VJX67_07740 [Blastocatellia bacterium]|nr:hypothetical protein [Blastocatellia bacterium]
MIRNSITGKLASGALVIGMLAVMGAMGSTANSQERNNFREGYQNYVSVARYQDQDRDDQSAAYDLDDIARIAKDNGFRDGLRAGREDREDGNRFDARNHIWYQNADTGYRSEFGHIEFYQRTYRQSFIQGYSEGFRRSRR